MSAIAPPTPVLPPAQRRPQVMEYDIAFQPFCFQGTAFPACDFENPEAAREFFGPYRLTVTFYNAQRQVVRSAEAVGRYAAVVEIHTNQRVSRRFVTLCRMGGKAVEAKSSTQALMTAGGIDAELLAQRQEELVLPPPDKQVRPSRLDVCQGVWAAGLFDLMALRARGQSLPIDTLLQLNKQWWVEFKRHFYGLDKVHPGSFISPRPLEGRPAPVPREGTLEEAGMTAAGRRGIEANATAWVEATGVGCAVCVVRHGVIALHSAWGNISDGPNEGTPYTPDTIAPLASTTKFLSAILMMQFVDQGLVALDQPAAKYVPALKGLHSPNPPTVRDLYLHTAGFTGHWGDGLNDMEEIVADIYPTLRSTPHQYHGTGHALGGKIMESIAGESMPRLYRRLMIEPLGCKNTRLELTSYGSFSTAGDLARIGQMMLNGGAFGPMRFLTPATIRQCLPIPGRDRFEPEMDVRWGVGIKQPDLLGLSDQAFGGSGATGCFLVIDPQRDLVIAHTRFDEGSSDHQDFRKSKGAFVKSIIASLV